MRIVLRQFGAEVRTFEACKPESAGRNSRVGTTDHLEFKIGDDAVERHWRMRKKGAVAEAPEFLRTKQSEDDRAARARPCGKDVRQGENGGSTGGVIIGAVVVAVAGCVGGAYAEVVQMRGQQNNLLRCDASAKDADCVPGLLARYILK